MSIGRHERHEQSVQRADEVNVIRLRGKQVRMNRNRQDPASRPSGTDDRREQLSVVSFVSRPIVNNVLGSAIVASAVELLHHLG
jgi:hypothetical protein